MRLCWRIARGRPCALRSWTAELGAYAGLARSTATEHVGVLVGRGIAVDTRQGRHRYISLAGDDIARVIEALGVVTEDTLPTPPSLNAWTANKQLRQGRTCYKHLAGRLGVGLTARFRARGLVDRNWRLTRNGEELLTTWGVLPGESSTENLVTPCMDSTERRFHLAGPLGTAICRIFFSRGWLERLGATRAVRLPRPYRLPERPPPPRGSSPSDGHARITLWRVRRSTS